MIIFPCDTEKIDLLYIIESFRKAGLLNEILLIVSPEFFETRKPNVPHIIIDDFAREDILINKLVIWKFRWKAEFTDVIATDDDEQFRMSKRIAAEFDLPFYKSQTLWTACTKYLMKEAFAKHNVPMADYTLAESPDEVSLGFPNIMKVMTGGQSIHLYKNNTRKELEDNFAELKGLLHDKTYQTIFHEGKLLNPAKIFLVEEFLEGIEFSCDFRFKRGKLQILRVARKIPAQFMGYFQAYHLMNRRSISEHFDIEDLELICSRIAAAFQITEGVCMVDFKVSSRKIKVIESSIRPGFTTFIILMHLIYGYTSWEVLARMKLARFEDKEIPEDEGLIYYLWAEKEGVIQKISFEELGHSGLDIIKVIKYSDVGEKIIDSNADHYNMLLAAVLVKNPKDILGTLRKINNLIELDIR
jgi:hypothetical protein